MKPSVQKALIIYSAVLSTTLVVVLLMGSKSHGSQRFGELQVQRINVVEPDGTLRMVISDHSRMPGVIVKGKESPKVDRPQAGMLFYNDEGSENGALIFGGHRNEQGEVVNSGGSLTFDQYGASQIVQLAGVDDKDNKFAGLAVNDQGRERGRRIWVGRGPDDASIVSLMDAKGKKRIVMKVDGDGAASLDFLDANGQVVRRLVPGN